MPVNTPHIILIMTDQHRGDCLGCAGNDAIITPNLDKLASDGVFFTNAYTTTPSCTPARAALLTGLAPWHNGMLGYGRVAPKYRYEMPRMLKKAGYYTFGIGKMHWFPQYTLHGFHGTLIDSSGRSETPGYVSDYRKWFKEQAPGLDPDATWKQAFGRDDAGWNDNLWADYAFDEKLHPTHWTGMTAVRKIKEHDPEEKPLFLKVSFARPHSPYDAPSRFVNMYDWKDMPEPVIGDWAAEFKNFFNDTLDKGPPFGDFGVEHAKRARRHYYANITFIDEEIGHLLDVLKEKGMYDDSLIIFTADHGEMTGDHYHWRKAYAYEGSAKIPYILKWPSNTQAAIPRGSTLPHPVELRDILPTFLDAAGTEIPSEMDGASLLPLVEEKAPSWREFIDLEHSVTYDPHNYWTALTDGKIKYIYFRPSGKEQLFDLENDPGELHDVSGEKAFETILKTWRKRMVDHLRERGDGWVKDGKLVTTKENTLYSPNHPEWQHTAASGEMRQGPDGCTCINMPLTPDNPDLYEIPLIELLDDYIGDHVRVEIPGQSVIEGTLESHISNGENALVINAAETGNNISISTLCSELNNTQVTMLVLKVEDEGLTTISFSLI